MGLVIYSEFYILCWGINDADTDEEPEISCFASSNIETSTCIYDTV